ncbi:MAG: FixH family protein [Epsilonproteobacteria bacterium]|nr:FixH family protein [Campylobacterota bacterium]
MKKSLSTTALLSTLTFGAGFMDMGMSGDLHIMLSSPKVLSQGENKINVEINRGGHGGDVVRAKDVRVKFFMPKMPGMPYMESKDICKNMGNHYECNINFAMDGTWQYQLFIKDEQGKDIKYKGSVNLGQASSHHHGH